MVKRIKTILRGYKIHKTNKELSRMLNILIPGTYWNLKDDPDIELILDDKIKKDKEIKQIKVEDIQEFKKEIVKYKSSGDKFYVILGEIRENLQKIKIPEDLIDDYVVQMIR